MTAPVSLYTISAVIVMDLDGKRLLAKYYDTASPQFATLKSQQAFERTLHSRTASHLNNMYNEDEVAMLNGYVAVYRANLDLIVYVVGTSSQNELVLTCALDTIFDVFSELLKYVKGYHVRVFIPVCRPQMDKSGFVENFELVALALDEIVDRGIILETEPHDVLAKVTKPQAPSLKTLVERPLEKQTLTSAFKMAKEQIRSFW